MSDFMLGPFFENFSAMWPIFRSGLVATLALAGGAISVAVVVGSIICAARMAGGPALRRMALAYIEIMRGTPALVQLFLIYFGLARIGISLEAFQAAVLGLGLNLAAYIAETMRAGILSISRGQSEAAMALGMTPTLTMRFVILPQALRVMLPPLGNSAISLVKDTSIAALISAPDLVLQARSLSSEYFIPLPIFLFAGFLYFCICFPLSMLFRSLERRWTV